jgi:hypothetical protein
VPTEFVTINAALDSASPGDTVLVAPGTYADFETRAFQASGTFLVSSLVFLKGDVVVASEDGPTSTHLNLLGGGDGDYSIPVFGWLFGPGHAILEGFSVTGAPIGNRGLQATQSGKVTIRNCIFQNLDVRGTSRPYGGAVLGDITQLDVVDCEFLDCHADVGGAIYQLERTVRIEGCRFLGCSNGAVNVVGSLHYPNDTAAILESEFANNSGHAALAGGAFGGEVVERNVFFDNSAGALAMSSRVLAVIRNNVMVNNHRGEGGGAIQWGQGAVTIDGNTLANNSTSGGLGAAIRFYTVNGTMAVRRNIITGSTGDEAIYMLPTNDGPISECNDFWNNPDGDFRFYTPGPTDIFVDPEFCNPDAGDFTLSSTSPCLPGNSNGCGLIGALGMGCGTVSVTPMSWGRIKNQYRSETNPEGR